MKGHLPRATLTYFLSFSRDDFEFRLEGRTAPFRSYDESSGYKVSVAPTSINAIAFDARGYCWCAAASGHILVYEQAADKSDPGKVDYYAAVYGAGILPCKPDSTLLAVYEANKSVRSPLTSIVMEPSGGTSDR